MASYNARSKANKIFVHYTSIDKTVKEKWININDKTVIFDNKEFHILTERIKSRWLCKGFNMFFPTRVNYIEFSWFSRWPHNPNYYNLTIVDPSVSRLINKQDMVKSYVKSSNPAVGKTQSKLMSILPVIAILAVALLAVYMFSENEAMKQWMAQIQNGLNAINQR